MLASQLVGALSLLLFAVLAAGAGAWILAHRETVASWNSRLYKGRYPRYARFAARFVGVFLLILGVLCAVLGIAAALVKD